MIAYGEKFITVAKSKSGTGVLISIILPVFNGEKYLAQSIRSCLNQTYSNIELVIVNDCSTDGSLGIAEKFAAEDSRVRIISNKENRKLPASLNVGHRLANGRYLTWTSDDNFFEPEALEILLKEIGRTNADVAYSNFNIIEEDGSLRREISLGKGDSLILGNTIGACFLYTSIVFERNGGYDEELHAVEDYDFWLQALLHSEFCHVPATLYNFRSHANSLSSNLNQRDLKFSEKLEKSYSKFFQKLNINPENNYSKLFADLHQHNEIGVKPFLENYSELREILEALSVRIGKKEATALQKELDLRLRDNLENYPGNQKLEILFKILYMRPQVLLNYDRRRSLRIIKKCIKAG